MNTCFQWYAWCFLCNCLTSYEDLWHKNIYMSSPRRIHAEYRTFSLFIGCVMNEWMKINAQAHVWELWTWGPSTSSQAVAKLLMASLRCFSRANLCSFPNTEATWNTDIKRTTASSIIGGGEALVFTGKIFVLKTMRYEGRKNIRDMKQQSDWTVSSPCGNVNGRKETFLADLPMLWGHKTLVNATCKKFVRQNAFKMGILFQYRSFVIYIWWRDDNDEQYYA